MITRRRLLTSALLTGGLSPLARCLGQSAHSATTGESPHRFVFFLQGNGFYPRHLQPEGIPFPTQPSAFASHSPQDHALPHSIAPLERFKNRLILIQGLSSRVAGPPPHSADFGALGCYPQREGAHGPTIDGTLAAAFPGIFPHIGLGVSGHPGDTVIYNVSAAAKNRPLPTQCQPTLAYQRLFASTGGGDSRKRFDARTHILDFLQDDVRKLQHSLGSAGNEQLGHYLSALESMGDRQADLARAATRISTNRTTLDPKKLPHGPGGFAHLDAQFGIATAALASGLTNVATISSASGLGFLGLHLDGQELGFAPGPIDLHSVGHGTGFCGATPEQLHTAIHHRHARSLATFLQSLEAIPEGEGTLLDHTTIIYLSDQAESHHPRCFEWPAIIIGSGGGKLRTGRHLHYPWYGNPRHRTLSNLYTTLLHAAGKPQDRFGLPDESLSDLHQDGPLDELLA